MKRLLILVFLIINTNVLASSPWQAGRLDYQDGSAEISAFVNTEETSQLQVVLCSKNQDLKYRFTLLLKQDILPYSIFEVSVNAGGSQSTAYAEVVGNSLEFQIDPNILISLTDSPSLTISFKEEDARALGLSSTIDINMTGADLTLKAVGSECTSLCVNDNFKCQESLVSAILWPRSGFVSEDSQTLKYLCTKNEGDLDSFDLSNGCKLALNRYYTKNGIGPLSFIYKLMHDENGSYQKYRAIWNEAVAEIASSPLGSNIYVDDLDWYLLLYSLINPKELREIPKSFYEILDFNDDPITLVYDIDNRYEMEALKYTAVLMRRYKTSISTTRKINRAITEFNNFYRAFSNALPQIKEAQALKPLVYRQMLMRLWRSAGMPLGLSLKSEAAFVQGSGGKLSTDDALEQKCAYFDGAGQDEFFMATNECYTGIRSSFRDNGFKTVSFDRLKEKWLIFQDAWEKSIFFNEANLGQVKNSLQSSFALTMLSALKIYGFGDYFLLRECISTRDSDICAFEKDRSYQSYTHEFKNRIASISAVSNIDAKSLISLNKLWNDYYLALRSYMDDLVKKDKIPLWHADFVLGIASIAQTDILLNAQYYKEELPDESLFFESDDFDDTGLVKSDSKNIKLQNNKSKTELVQLDNLSDQEIDKDRFKTSPHSKDDNEIKSHDSDKKKDDKFDKNSDYINSILGFKEKDNIDNKSTQKDVK